MKDYKIIMTTTQGSELGTLIKLQEEVNDKIKDGYIPIGNPQKFDRGYYQAVYKDDLFNH